MSTLRGEPPILQMVDRAIQVGYMAALKDIQNGTFDDDILQWRPDLAED
ncbi:hypothetical protein [Actinoallomurus sp. NPDC052274]